jgi:hypothetical protein
MIHNVCMVSAPYPLPKYVHGKHGPSVYSVYSVACTPWIEFRGSAVYAAYSVA